MGYSTDFRVTSGFHKWASICIALLAALLFSSTPKQTLAKQSLFESYKRIVVLDPGHGGQETGARGPDGTLEKSVTLALARLIAVELEPDLKVVLTRTDDYLVELDNRTSLANHLNADIFISIHTGASFVHKIAGTSLYYYQNFSESDPRAEQNQLPAGRKNNSGVRWQTVQNIYTDKSRKLAEIIQARLNHRASNPSRIEGAPLAVLQGAAMPAIVIEIGYLTNPATEKSLQEQRFLMDLAEQISLGITDFFSQNHQ